MAHCTICGGTSFGAYRGRQNARCATCGSKERARLMALVIRRFTPQSCGKPVYHFAPEAAIADVLIEKYGKNYQPADFSPEIYSWSEVPLKKVDLSSPLKYISPQSLHGLVHSHVLEHIPASLDYVLEEMNKTLLPGGFHLFQVPIIDGWYREDMNPDMPVEERIGRFFQDDHLRMFGSRDFEDRVLRLFRKGFRRIDLSQEISKEELTDAAVPRFTLEKVNGHTAFLFIKE